MERIIRLHPRRHPGGSLAGAHRVFFGRREMMDPGLRRAGMTVFVIGMLFSCSLYADSPQDLFKQGNAAYAQGKFEESARLYQSAYEGGLQNDALFYNLGNAAYKSGQLGRAVLNYERAFRRSSGDRDVIYNLRLATTKAGDPEVPLNALPALVWRLFFMLSLNTLTALASLVSLGLAVWLGFVLAGKASWKIDAVVPALFVLFVLGAWLGARIYFYERPEGVVLTSVAEVRSGPNTSYPANFTVPEGHRVLILDEQEPVAGWIEVGLPDQGLKGWVPDASVEKI